MVPRFLGYLSDRHLALYEIASSGWRLLREFAAGEAAELPAYLPPNQPFHLLADLVEMEFRCETVPWVRGRDRRDLHQRKIEQTFPATSFRHAASLGREPGRHGREKLLLSAITHPALLHNWLKPLGEHRLPLAGIAGLPMLQQRLAVALAGADNPQHLLIVVQGHGGIRISYFHARELRFSRLAAAAGSHIPLAQAVHEEAVRTRQYLLSLHLLERNDPLTAICLLPDTQIADWEAADPAAEGIEFRLLGLAEAARLAGLKPAEAGRSSEDLCIALLLKSHFPNHFAPAAERRDFQFHRLRRTLLAGSGLLALGTLAAGAALLQDLPRQHREIRHAQAGTAVLNAEIDRMRAGFPRIGVPIEEIRETLTLARRLAEENAPSRRLLADISRGFDTVAQAELKRLTWFRGDPADRTDGNGPPALRTAARDGWSSRMRWVAIVRGDIVGIHNFRKANAMANSLGEAIRRDGVEVEILQYPFNLRPDSEVVESFGQPMAERLPFTLRITWNE